jgi:hypothetical protein
MSLADRTEIPDEVRNGDLARLGKRTRALIIGELLSLRRRSERDCPELSCQWGGLRRRKRNFGGFVIVFHLRREEDQRVAVVEGIIPRSGLQAWFQARIDEAETWEPDQGREGQ